MLCENCNKPSKDKRFCCLGCARSFSTKHKRKQINQKVSAKMKGRIISSEHKQCRIISKKIRRKIICQECGEHKTCSPSSKIKFCSVQCWKNNCNKNKTDFQIYREQCKFDFDVHNYKDKLNLEIVDLYGWYSPKNKRNNLSGVSKDHMFSVKDGFKLKILPYIMRHPANCELMPHPENQRKKSKSSITLEALIEKIKSWNT
jgi:hypothetical protein